MLVKLLLNTINKTIQNLPIVLITLMIANTYVPYMYRIFLCDTLHSSGSGIHSRKYGGCPLSSVEKLHKWVAQTPSHLSCCPYRHHQPAARQFPKQRRAQPAPFLHPRPPHLFLRLRLPPHLYRSQGPLLLRNRHLLHHRRRRRYHSPVVGGYFPSAHVGKCTF